MAILVSDVIDGARVLLNDVAAARYTDTVMLPIVKKAYRELQQEMFQHGVAPIREISTVLAVAANALVFTAQPADLVYPIKLYERPAASGDLEDFVEMTEEEWEPDENPGKDLEVWSWREELVNFRGATTAKEVRMRYKKSLTAITAGASAITPSDALTFLESRSGAIAAAVVGSSSARARDLQQDANWHLGVFLNNQILNKQGTPIRRLPYRPGYR